jgi:nitroreductase
MLITVYVLMNSVIEAINGRCSVRAYEQKPVPKNIIEEIIKAANQAPFTSMTRSQPWRFVVVENKEFKQKLLQTTLPFWKNAIGGMKETAPELYEMASCIYEAMDEPKDPVYYNAPVIIFVVGPANNPFSCVLACENMMIAAQSFGLGTCYVGFGAMVKGNPEIVKALELKDDEGIYGPILVGYPKANPSEALSEALSKIRPLKKPPVTKWI